MPFDPVEYAIKKTADVLLEAAKRVGLRDPDIVAFLEEHGFKRLEPKFETVYVYTVVALLKEGKPRSILELFRDKRVAEAFAEAWRVDKPIVFSEETVKALEALAVGDEIKQLGINVQQELKHFREVFSKTVSLARTPGEQEELIILGKILAEVAKPPATRMLSPNVDLVRAYLQQVAAQEPYVLWSDQTYIDRTVAKSDDLFARSVARFGSRETEEPELLDIVLAREKKLMLLGEPGMGKTTSLLHLAWQAAQRGLTNPSDAEIPIYLELKYYSGEELETLLVRRVNDILRARNLSLSPDLAESTRILKEWLAQTDARFLLLLDGLNEVRPEHHTAVRGALEAMLNSPHRIVISCRERDYDASLREHVTAFVIQELQWDRIGDYLLNSLGRKGWELFDEQIWEDKKMLTLAANPLMLWLISVVAQGDPEVRLPKNRGKLFQQFVAMMPRLRMKDGMRPEIAPDVVQTALAKLGFEMQERGRLSVDLREVRGWQIPPADEDLEEVLTQAKDWRLLKSDGRLGEQIEFLHQLFLEYFAAVHLKKEIGILRFEILGDRPFNERWNEVLMMLMGISNQPSRLVKWLGAQALEKKQVWAAFFVKDCWETSDAATDDEARSAVANGFIAVLRDADMSMRPSVAEALGEIGDVRAVEPLIAALSYANKEMRQCAIVALGKIGDGRAAEPLVAEMYDASEHESEIIADALQRIGAAAVEPLIAVLQGTDGTVRVRAGYILEKISSPAVESLIALLHDTDEWVRGRAAVALGRIGNVRAVAELERVAREDSSRSWWGRVADAAQEAAEKIKKRMREGQKTTAD